MAKCKVLVIQHQCGQTFGTHTVGAANGGSQANSSSVAACSSAANGGSSANGVSAAKSGFVDTDSSAANGVFKSKMGFSRPT